MAKNKYRIEKDTLGEVKVPRTALFGAQTQRAINNFGVFGHPFPAIFIKALVATKIACAQANVNLGLLENNIGRAIEKAGNEIFSWSDEKILEHFPVSIFQTGSGTSTNMNANEVIANLASAGIKIHPNNHVNMSQSSNDVIPTAIHVSACWGLVPLKLSLQKLVQEITKKSTSLKDKIKTGRTHLMDAMPISFEQELSGWSKQIEKNIIRIEQSEKDLQQLAIGGTAVGTGVNAHKNFSKTVCQLLKDVKFASYPLFIPNKNKFEALSSQEPLLAMSGQLRTTATSFIKISNDLRLMNSGPNSGISDITLEAVQPGSSIMPGKVNPVMPEAILMACAEVIGNDTTIAIAAQSGNFQLNVMLPVASYNILRSIVLLTTASNILRETILNFSVNDEKITADLGLNPILVTALNSIIGYEKGAEIAKQSYAEQRSVIDVAKECTDLTEEELTAILDPKNLIKQGVRKK
jgi:fumarate hydratase class II